MLGETLFRQRFARLLQQVFDAVALLLVAAEFVIARFQHLACLDELLVDEQALIEVDLALGFEVGQRRLSRFKLLRDLGLARFELGELAAHAQQRLFKRIDACAFGFYVEREPVRLLRCLARIHARFLACFEQATAFAIEMLAMLFLVAHARDGFFEPRACFARSDITGGELGFEFGDFAVDARYARLRGFELAAVALQSARKLGHAAVRDVEFALRVVARAFGIGALRLDFVKARVERRDAFLGGGEFVLERVDFLLACDHARLRVAAPAHAREARAEPFAGRRNDGFVRREAAGARTRRIKRIGGVNAVEDMQRG
ncbi:MAG TPA: hypothetical protein VFA35_09450 [Burkholderiaceae bacterium]|nr:hypothetical protein [Burkholderiaceae bacterium]